jgi:membrane protein
MINIWKRLHDYIVSGLWAADGRSLSRTRSLFLHFARFTVVIIRDILYGQVTLWAMSLVYTTLMSLVPLLAVAFSVLKAFGVQNKLEPFLQNLVAPLGPNGPVIANRIVEFVNNMKVGVLGVVGLGLLVYTVMSLIQKIEQAFNTIWRVRGQRNVLHQFTEYLSVILVGPVLVVSALALTASLMSTTVVQRLMQFQPVGAILAEAGRFIPYLLVCAAFTFLYLFIPNTRVRWSAALAGGLIGGVLWETVGWGFASFIVASTKYAAIYSGFAILILFMTWIYLSWLILLIGCEVAFYYQNPRLLSIAVMPEFPNARLTEQVAVSVMFLIASHFYHDLPPWTVNALAGRLGLPLEKIEQVLAALRSSGLLRETAGDPPAYVPARDLDRILLHDIYDAVRKPAGGASRAAAVTAPDAAEKLEREVDAAIGSALGSRSVKDLVLSR